jgi:hypothetical protein
MTKKIVKAIFPESQIQLMREVENHPELKLLLTQYHPSQFEEILGEIAAFVGVILDGVYEGDRIYELFDLLTKALKQKRIIIIP